MRLGAQGPFPPRRRQLGGGDPLGGVPEGALPLLEEGAVRRARGLELSGQEVDGRQVVPDVQEVTLPAVHFMCISLF